MTSHPVQFLEALCNEGRTLSFVLLRLLKTGSYTVAQAGLELVAILLLQRPLRS